MVPISNVIHLVLVGAFVSLSMRSLDRQHQIEALEAERVSLEQENKGLKKRIWNLKQGMLEEAAKQDDRNLILRLKTLFGDSIVQENKMDSLGPNLKFVL
jgi:cell division protein FtsB